MSIHTLISKWLRRAGIMKVDDLTPDERTTYENYQRILSGENLSVETIKQFCQHQIKRIEEKFASQGKQDDDAYLKACLHVYLNILKCIEAGETERINLENYLNSLI